MSWDVLGKANTNLIKYSEDFSQWSGIADVSSTTKPYFGGATVWTFADNLTTAVTTQTISPTGLFETVASGTVVCYSLHVEKDSTSKIVRIPRMRILWDTNTKNATLLFDTSTGETNSTNSPGVTVIGHGSEETDDYFRVYIAASYAGSLSRLEISPASQNGDLLGAAQSSITGSMTCFGAMLNYGNMPLPYRKTDGTEISWSGQSDDSQSWSTQSKKPTTWVTA